MAKFNRPLKLVPVKSSNIEAIGYSKANESLVIRFRNKSEYLYPKVPKATYDAIMASESKGSFFHTEIRQRYEGVKIKQKEAKDAKETKKA
jgi:hypothetical protein